MPTQFRLYEPPAGGISTNYTGLEAQAQAANITWVLPAAQGAANTSLKNDGSGNLSWSTPTITQPIVASISVLAAATQTTTYVFTGALVGDVVSLGLPASFAVSGIYVKAYTTAGFINFFVENTTGSTFNFAGPITVQVSR